MFLYTIGYWGSNDFDTVNGWWCVGGGWLILDSERSDECINFTVMC